MRVVLLALLASACAPRLFVNVLQPAPVNLGAAKKLTVFEAQGRKSARDEVLQELATQVKNRGYFTLTDRSEEGITVTFVGRNVTLSKPPPADEVGLRIDVVDWNAEKEQEQTKDKKGNPVVKDHWVGRVLFLVTAFNAEGKSFMAEKEYKASARDDNDEDAAILAAGKDAIAMLLEDLTPTYVQKAIRLDDEEEAQRPIIDIARGGDIPRALDAEKQLLAKSPNSAVAIFNQAVLLDVQGLYKEALPLYDQAIKLRSKDFYFDVRRECAQRLADAEALAR
jgi:tetratricopeptide (TPR) repeat protein